MMDGSNSLFNRKEPLFLGFIRQLNILSDLNVILKELFGELIKASIAHEHIDLIVLTQIMFHQLNCPEVIPLVLLNADHLALFQCFLDNIEHVVTETGASAVVVKDQY